VAARTDARRRLRATLLPMRVTSPMQRVTFHRDRRRLGRLGGTSFEGRGALRGASRGSNERSVTSPAIRTTTDALAVTSPWHVAGVLIHRVT
jgi:hypothetical protein